MTKIESLTAQIADTKAAIAQAQAQASEAANLTKKLEALARARAGEGLLQELSAQLAAAQAEARHLEAQAARAASLEAAKAIAARIAPIKERLELLAADAEKAIGLLIEAGPQLLDEWAALRDEWISLLPDLRNGRGLPHWGNGSEGERDRAAFAALLEELGPPAKLLMLTLEYPAPSEERWREPTNWAGKGIESAGDVVSWLIDTKLKR